MKIGEFSERTGLPVSTLHFYERKGLICPERNRSGHREYSDADLSWVAFIQRLKETGLPLAQIKRYADLRAQGDSTMEERMDMLTSHRERVLGEMAKWRENLSHLDDKIASLQRIGCSDSWPWHLFREIPFTGCASTLRGRSGRSLLSKDRP